MSHYLLVNLMFVFFFPFISHTLFLTSYITTIHHAHHFCVIERGFLTWNSQLCPFDTYTVPSQM